MRDPAPTSFREGHSAELLEAVYDQLRAIAQQRISSENPGHTLQATALVHEAFLRVGRDRRVAFQNRAHFFAAAAEAMRRILIDHARSKQAAKRRPPGTELMSVVDLAECPDRDETILRLAFQAAKGGFNALVQGDVTSRKVRNHGYQKSVWSGTAFAADVDEEKLNRNDYLEEVWRRGH